MKIQFKIEKQPLSDKDNTDKYLLKSDNKEFGYSYIYHGSNINNIYIFINPKYRSNGLGSILFKNMLKKVKTLISDSFILLDIDKVNTPANNIIAKNGGTILAEDLQTHWMLKL